MVRIALSLILALAVAGCAASGTQSGPTASAAEIPAGTASLTVNRSNDLGYFLGKATLTLDGASIAELGVGQNYVRPIKPGTHIISVWAPWETGRYSARFTAEEGKQYRFVVSPNHARAAAGALGGLVGSAIYDRTNENSGPFKIVPEN